MIASTAEIKEIYEQIGVSKGVILPSVSPECGLNPQPSEGAYRLVQKYPDLFYWFCNIDPRNLENSPKANLSYMLEYYKDLGAKGVGEVTTNLYFDDPYMENLFYHCQKCKMPLLFHIAPAVGESYGIADDLGLPRLEKILAKFPDLQFLGHSTLFWTEISSDVTEESRRSYHEGEPVKPGRVVELMRKYPNLCGDISAGSGYFAITRDSEFSYDFIEEFQDRIYFGTDICSPLYATSVISKLSSWLDDAMESGKISKTAYKKVSYENALKLLEG